LILGIIDLLNKTFRLKDRTERTSGKEEPIAAST